jgi:hypothetical protein
MNNMKKFNLEFLSQVSLSIFGIALFIVGAIITITSFFTPLAIPPALLAGILAVALGTIAYGISKLYFIILQLIKTLTDLLTSFNSKQTSPFNNLPTNTEIISINENTSPEDIEKIKNKIPGAGAALENIFKIIHGEQSSKKELSEMSREELQKEMEEAVNLNNFEKAATIRDILKNK